MFVGGNVRDRLVKIRVEHLPLGVDGREPRLQQDTQELVVNELKTVDDRLVRLMGAGVAQAALEVVHDRQELKQKVRVGPRGHLVLIAERPLAEIIVVRLQAQDAVIEFLDFGRRFPVRGASPARFLSSRLLFSARAA